MNGFAFEACGLRIGVRVNDDRYLERARRSLETLTTRPTEDELVDQLFSVFIGKPSPRRGVRNFNFLFLGTSQHWKIRNIDEVFEMLAKSVRTYLAFASPEQTAVHGLLLEQDNRVVMLAGLDNDEALLAQCAAEAHLLSNEFGLLQRNGQVRPYPEVSPPLAIDAVVFLEFDDAAPLELHRLTPGQAALSLMPRASSLTRAPSTVLGLLRDFSMQARAVKVKCGRADFSVARIFSALAAG